MSFPTLCHFPPFVIASEAKVDIASGCHCERSEVPLCGTPLMSGTQERGNLAPPVSSSRLRAPAALLEIETDFVHYTA